MLTIRSNTFETNSSSAHCYVVANNEAFSRFVNGELFADGFGGKFPYDATLIDEDAVYLRYDKYFIDYLVPMRKNEPKLSKETVLWFLRHPKEISPFEQGDINGEYVVDEMPQAIKDECTSNYWGVASLICWMELEESPLSYAALVEKTSNFTSVEDDYRSQPPTEKDGTTTCKAVFYY